MNIIFEKLSAPETYGGNVRTLAPQRALKMQRDSIPLPAGSVQSTRAPFKHGEPLQSALDCLAVFAIASFITVTGVGLAFALFVLMFVRL